MSHRRAVLKFPMQLTFPDVRESALDWTRRSLHAELASADASQISQLAEGLIRIAEDRHIAIEHLVQWIHSTREHSLSAFAEWCNFVNAIEGRR